MEISRFSGSLGSKPLTQITPFTYRDGLTFLQILNEFENWLEGLGVELNTKLLEYLANVEGLKNGWQNLFDEFMADVMVRLEGLNDQAVANLVNNSVSKIRVAIDDHFVSRENLEQLSDPAVSSLVDTSDTLVRASLNKYFTNRTQKNVRAGLNALPDNDGEKSVTPSNGGYNLVAIGHESLKENVRGWNNTAVGFSTLRDNIDGYNNTAVGDAVLERNVGGIGDTGTSNIAPGSRNTGVGSYALRYNTTGHGNVGIGRNAAHTNVSGAYNTAVGTNAYSGQFSNEVGDKKTANDNTAIGYNAAFKTNANNNTALGAHSLYENISGAENTALGHSAGYGITNGAYNVAIGNRAMLSKNTGGSNTAVGVASLSNAASGNRNTALGVGALAMLASGSSNVAIGYNAGWAPPETLIGINSTVSIGAESLAQHTGSVALGYQTKTTTVSQVAIGARHLELSPITGVGSPVDAARIYTIVDGGKYSIAVRFPNGEIKVLAKET